MKTVEDQVCFILLFSFTTCNQVCLVIINERSSAFETNIYTFIIVELN